MEQKYNTLYRCWNCGEPIVKANGESGLIKSQVIFFSQEGLNARCKRCKSPNVIPMNLNKSQSLPLRKSIDNKGPKLAILVPKNKLSKSLQHKTLNVYNKEDKTEDLKKGQKFTRGARPGHLPKGR